MIAVAAGEAAQPEVAITRAFLSTVVRLVLFYVLTLALMLAVLPWTQAGSAKSPFVMVMDALRVPVRALRAAGAEILILTNAAGSLRPDVGPGRLMAITDHINFTGTNVLIGPNDAAMGERFPPMRDAYDPQLLGELRAAARALEIPLAEGVYLAVSGPSFETAAEIRAFKTVGADAVGMSTVHETTVARHCGLSVLAVSAITNLAEGMAEVPLSHEHTLRDANRAAGDLSRLLLAFLERVGGPDAGV